MRSQKQHSKDLRSDTGLRFFKVVVEYPRTYEVCEIWDYFIKIVAITAKHGLAQNLKLVISFLGFSGN